MCGNSISFERTLKCAHGSVFTALIDAKYVFKRRKQEISLSRMRDDDFRFSGGRATGHLYSAFGDIQSQMCRAA